MAEEKKGPDIFRIVGFALLGAFLVAGGFLGRGMVDESSVTDGPSNWLGPSFTGTVVSYQPGQSITVQGEDSQWSCDIEKGTQLSSATGEQVAVGSLVQIRYRGGAKPSAKNIRVIRKDGPAGATTAPATGTPGTAATPATATATPAASATP